MTEKKKVCGGEKGRRFAPRESFLPEHFSQASNGIKLRRVVTT